MIRPSEEMALYRADMADWEWAERGQQPGWRLSNRNWVRANDACRLDILDRLGSSGPLPSRDLPDHCKVPWRSTGWTNNRNVTQLLEFMVVRGEAAIAGRRGGERLWDLATRVYPDAPVVPSDEAADPQRVAAAGSWHRALGDRNVRSSRPTGRGGRGGRGRGRQGQVASRCNVLGQPFSGAPLCCPRSIG
jgi:uncharacterized protein YcaQ